MKIAFSGLKFHIYADMTVNTSADGDDGFLFRFSSVVNTGPSLCLTVIRSILYWLLVFMR